jgi:uncharacterized membrane protein
MPSIRDSLVAELQAVLGPDVHVVAYQDATDVLERRTVIVKQQSITRHQAAPMGSLRIDYVLTFVSAAVDPATAEADLDVWVPESLDDLRMSWFAWTTATKALFGSTNLCYDVDAYVLTTPANEPKE